MRVVPSRTFSRAMTEARLETPTSSRRSGRVAPRSRGRHVAVLAMVVSAVIFAMVLVAG